VLFLAGTVLVAGCGSGGSSKTAPSAKDARSGYPVVLDNCGQQVRIDRAPRRAVALDQGSAEILFSLGLADRIGSIAKGKRADLIMVSSRDINMGPFTDPYHMLVDSAQPWNVDTVMVDGRIVKRGGKLTAIDTVMLMTEAAKASREVRDRAKWW